MVPRRRGVSMRMQLTAVGLVIVVGLGAAYYYLYYLNQPAKVTLTIYGSPDTKDIAAAIRDFHGNYSYITVNYNEMTPPNAFNRITTELQANQSSADIAFITNSLMNPLKAAGDLIPYNSSQRSNYPSNYYDAKGNFATAMLLPVVFSYNTQLVSASTLASLRSNLSFVADPYWKGKVIMHDVTLGSTGTQYLLSLVPIIGNATWTAWVQALATNVQPALTSDTGTVTQDVSSGLYQLGLISYLHDVVRLQGQGAPVSWFLPTGIPLLTAPSSIGIIKGTHNLAAAKLFEDFMLTKATQTVIGNSAVRFPALPGITAINTIEAVAPGAHVVFFPVGTVSAQAKLWGPKFKALGFG